MDCLRQIAMCCLGVAVLTLWSCGYRSDGADVKADVAESSNDRGFPDVGDVDHFHSCGAAAASDVSLTPQEVCEINALKSRCNVTDDCMVTCLASTGGREIGGGCAHICASQLNTIKGWRPPPDYNACPRRSRVDG